MVKIFKIAFSTKGVLETWNQWFTVQLSFSTIFKDIFRKISVIRLNFQTKNHAVFGNIHWIARDFREISRNAQTTSSVFINLLATSSLKAWPKVKLAKEHLSQQQITWPRTKKIVLFLATNAWLSLNLSPFVLEKEL